MLSRELMEKISAAARSSRDVEVILRPDFHSDLQNEALFFYKPEGFLSDDFEKFPRLNQMVIEKMGAFSTRIDGIILLGGPFLARARIMDRHYGFINRLSRSASELVSAADKQHICQQLGIDSEDYSVLGGHQFLETYPDFDDEQLNDFWLSKPSQKLRSGYYYQSFEVHGNRHILINGFHPQQLSHFTRPGRKIILYLLHSDTPWASLKNDLAGDTFPERALPGSIRGEIYAHRPAYGAQDMSISRNYVHLSAGPFEALYEIHNFLSEIPEISLNLHETGIGRRLSAQGRSHLTELATSNPALTVQGKITDLFTATENMDSDAAVDCYIHQLNG